MTALQTERELATMEPDGVEAAVAAVCRRSRQAARELAVAGTGTKDSALRAAAEGLRARADEIVAANGQDLLAGRENGLPEHLLDRLTLDVTRVGAVADALAALADLADPVGELVDGRTLPNGLRVSRRRVPLGVVGMIYEARPNVTVDAAGLGLKSGNAVVLRGGSAAARTNAVLIDVLRAGLRAAGLPADAVQTIDGHGREGVRALMRARGLVDLLVPRGGADLIATVVREATVPVVETGIGNCHVYVDAAADLDQALAITMDAKTSRPGVCNAAETLLVHADIAARFLPLVLRPLADAGVRLHGDPTVIAAGTVAGVTVEPATEEDWATEYHALELAVGVVDSLDDAIEHIRRWTTGHTEAICTTDLRAADRFAGELDVAVIAVNASTRFTDGEQLGLGAELGISTQKLHARGPMGLTELTTTTWLVTGDGHVRG